MAAALASQVPNDVMVDILSWLPVKSLIRFKCVQKSWLALIESPSFITKHSRHAISSLLVMRELKETGTSIVTLHPTGAAGDLTNLDLPAFYRNQSFVDISPVCVNGIICLNIGIKWLRDDDISVVLWNPSIRHYWVVPTCPFSVPPTEFDTFPRCLGFGYDAKSDDYKVIVINSIVEYVYSFKENLWRTVDAGMGTFIPGANVGEIFLNGIYHWCGSDFDSDGNVCKLIVGYDISKEVFFKMELPDFLYPRDKTRHKYITTLNNSFAMIIYKRLNYDEESFEIWVMNEYGLKESWEKRFTVGPLSRLPTFNIFGLWNNQKILTSARNGDIQKYDLESEDIEYLLHMNGRHSFLNVVNYTESLVSLNGDK